MQAQIDRLNYRTRISADPRMFVFSSAIKSKNGSHKTASEYHIEKFSTCVFCGSSEDVTMAHLISEVQESDGVSLAMFNCPHYKTDLVVKSPRNFIRLCGTKGRRGTCHDAFDHYCLSLIYDPAQGNYIIWSVDASSGLHQKRITLSTEFPPYKRLLCWRFRKSIETFGGLYEHLPQLESTIDYSEAGSTLGAGESKDDSVSTSDA
jgi:hypothetical protein